MEISYHGHSIVKIQTNGKTILIDPFINWKGQTELKVAEVAPAGILLFVEGLTIYHAGDTALFGDMKLIGERHPIDIAFLPIGDNFTMGPEDAACAVSFLKPKIVVPIHYNTFPPIKQDPQVFADLVQISEVQILKAGEKVNCF